MSAREQGWQPIETALKDGTRILICGGNRVYIARWDDDRYAQRPRPYFARESMARQSVTDDRAFGATHWMPLPAPPEAGQ